MNSLQKISKSLFLLGNNNLFSLKKDTACLPEDSESEKCFNVTAKSCIDASYLEKIIVFEETDEETSITYSNNCLTIKGRSNYDLLRASDKALFIMLGVI